MKNIFLLTILLLSPFIARADLLDQLNLEQTIQTRLQNTFKLYDDSAKISVSLEFNSYQGSLPGTNIPDGERITPNKIEMSDISKVHVEVFSGLEVMPKGAEEALMKSLPVANKKNVMITFNSVDPKSMKLSKSIEVKDLFEVAEKTTYAMGKFLFVVFLIGLVCTFVISNNFNKKRNAELKEQFKFLANAVAEGGGGSAPRAAAPQFTPQPQQQQQQTFAPPAPSKNHSTLDSLSKNSLKELFADCYWCEQDGYASWLWKNISSEQKKELIADLSFLKEYTIAFINTPAKGLTHHEHPYYMEPSSLAYVSQKDLSDVIKKEIGQWHSVSPMRKENMKLSFDEKLKATQSKPSANELSVKTKSPLRTLSQTPTWGELSFVDEIAIFNNPAMVPDALRRHVKTLAWLALKNPEEIKATLAKYDTRSLADAWVGPEEVLKALEAHMPEKKLKLLLAYKEKTNPSRTSDVYQLLVDEGLKREAA